MLYEMKGVRQEPGRGFRRWFHAEDMDLSVWLDGDRLIQFQLSYNHHHGEKSILWSVEKGFSHHKIDDGEQHPGHYKASPIVTGHLPLEFQQAIRSFKDHIADESHVIFEAVLRKLEDGQLA
ncbi:MAG: hypothetical protein CMN76_02895 [Spirochaetaceae bacterium]|nr:hypothetical protein [Spirochaetaceae bacterium]|tara:strand:- start:10709 stop:11074 length:366 start_codon:yes stop_codon:yes gene_type:complete